MQFGDIIKRSWKITWRYKALWVLGLFAGLSGCQGGGSSGGGGGGGNSSGNAGSMGDGTFGTGDLSRYLDSGGDFLQAVLPIVIAVVLVLIAMALVWSIATMAARAGLIVGVDEADQGRPRRLGELWTAGFHHFWDVVGLGILLKLPLIAAGLLFVILIAAPVIGTLAGGGEPGLATVMPICGVLIIGLPVLVVGGVILDVMYLIALRYLVLGDQGVFESARNAWKFFRARFKDTAIMYVINGGLNVAASFALAIPFVVLGVALVLPVVGAIASGDWRVLVLPVAVFVVLAIVISYLYTGVWGTFTSALWTLFFRAAMTPEAAPVLEAAVEQDPDA